MSAFLACYATDKGHGQALLLRKWTTAEALLSGSSLCRQKPRNDQKDSNLFQDLGDSRYGRQKSIGTDKRSAAHTLHGRRLCHLKELSDGQSESSVFRQESFKYAPKLALNPQTSWS